MPALAALIVAATVVTSATSTSADTRPGSGRVADTSPASAPPDCLTELSARGVAYRRATGKGLTLGVEILGPLGGVTYAGPPRRALIIDCSLAVSLDEAGPYLAALGIDHVGFSSAYQRRTVRFTDRPSKHSFGLAVDVHTLSGPALGSLKVVADYEQGLGDAVDCLGQPMTQGGAILKIVQCQLVRSGLFHLVLSPDYDDAHHDHFHLEARPWADRATLRAAPALH